MQSAISTSRVSGVAASLRIRMSKVVLTICLAQFAAVNGSAQSSQVTSDLLIDWAPDKTTIRALSEMAGVCLETKGADQWPQLDGYRLTGDDVLFKRGNSEGRRYSLKFQVDSSPADSSQSDSGESVNLEIDIVRNDGQRQQFLAKTFSRGGQPRTLFNFDARCTLRLARQIVYDAEDRPVSLQQLVLNAEGELTADGLPQLLNLPVPDLSADVTERQVPPIRVAMVDSGVDYRIAAISDRLARDPQGRLIGYDFWDLDDMPFDAHPVRSGFVVQRHGTGTASLLLEEAPTIELVAYRYPRPDMTRMADLIDHAILHGVKIIGMPLGGNKASEWAIFERSARAHPELLFIVSAGNNGRNIDDVAVYPAVLDLPNMLVVTSSDDFVVAADRANWGANSVDIMLPAENVSVTAFGGKQRTASGSSYAVSRLTALAANILTGSPTLGAAEIIEQIKRNLVLEINADSVDSMVSTGYLPDPLVVHNPAITLQSLFTTSFAEPVVQPSEATAVPQGTYRLQGEVLVLDDAWLTPQISDALAIAADVLGQCGIDISGLDVSRVQAPDYLRDLSTGAAHTLFDSVRRKPATLVFARDTRMQQAFTGEAFGRGNTATRSWLRNSVWLLPDIGDAGLGLAHEVFHILANSGSHSDAPNNLMQARTDAGNRKLSTRQCTQARRNGLDEGLLVAL